MYAGHKAVAMMLFAAPASAVACQYDDMAGGRFPPFHVRMAALPSSGDPFVDAILAERGEAPGWRQTDAAPKNGEAASPLAPASPAIPVASRVKDASSF